MKMHDTMARAWLGTLALGGVLVAAQGSAATFTVNSTLDTADAAPGDGACLTGGGVCTLRAAIQEANAFAGADLIHFAIGTGLQTIAPAAVLDDIQSVVTVDATTQPGFAGTPLIELNGAGVAVGDGLKLNLAASGGTTIKGLIIDQFAGGAGVRIASSSNNVIIGNYLGTDPTGTLARGNVNGVFVQGPTSTNNRIGGTTVPERNIVSGNTGTGIVITGAGVTNNLVEGNYIGLDVTGTVDLGNTSSGVDVLSSSANNTIGGTAAGTGNVISGNNLHGIRMIQAGTSGNVVQGNLIGTNAAGTAAIPNSANGVNVASAAASNTIGGTTPAARNVISGNGTQGVQIANLNTNNNVIAGNFIGTDVAGTAPIPNGSGGIVINSNPANNTIGGLVAGAGNLIAYNTTYGVDVGAGAGIGNAILRNSIHSNGELGIDLFHEAFLVTPNDTGDIDTGGNAGQNFPVLSAAMTDGAGTANFAGSFSSAASTTYLIEFFASSAADSSGFGEGERYLGFTNITTNASGDAIIGVAMAATLAAGELVTATATDPSNSTSEFSAAIAAVGSLVVTTTADTVDGNTASVSALIAAPGGDGRISLREAITAVNATPGTDTLRFGIPLTDANHFYYQNDGLAGSLSVVAVTTLTDSATASSPAISDFDPDYPAGMARSWYSIQPSGTALPVVTGVVAIDGTTQTGYLIGGPVIEIDGILLGAVHGLQIAGGGSTVRGLVINRFNQNGIRLQTVGGNVVAGNYVGTDVSGTIARGNQSAVDANAGSGNNTIGGTTAADRNILSGNTSTGVAISGTSGNVVLGNYIGTDVTGTADLGNNAGLQVFSTATNNTIGGTATGARNVISGNVNGITIFSAACTNNVVLGNYIGTDVTGTVDLGNSATGVSIQGTAGPGNTVGGAAVGARNIISGNDNFGVSVAASNQIVEGNYIGTDVTGTVGLGNSQYGLQVTGGSGTRIGGTAAGQGNVISSNTLTGVLIGGGTNTLVQGNLIGTDASGTADLGNNSNGVWVQTSSNTIGGAAAGARNVISGNNASGVRLAATTNVVQGNFIGTDITGSLDLGNTVMGILVESGNNTIGGTTAAERNIISGNDSAGVNLTGTAVTGTLVQGNYIGTDVSGTVDLGNTQQGVLLSAGATANTIGGTAAGAGNLISGNNQDGISLTGAATKTNLIQGNFIGTNAAGTAILGNTGFGVSVSGPNNTVGGTTASARNVISGNATGVSISTVTGTGEVVQGNYIGTDVSGTVDLGNSSVGVMVSSSSNTIGGTAAGAGNLISGNNTHGVSLSGGLNLVQGNFIGTDATGTADLGNSLIGVWLSGPTNTVGGTTAAARNVISGNNDTGITISGVPTTGNLVQGNYIGTDVSGTLDLGNSSAGVLIFTNASSNTIGGTAAGAGNVVSGNNGQGISIAGAGASNLVQGNFIGTNAAGTADLGNTLAGVRLASPNNTIGGSAAGAGNLISGNDANGVQVDASAAGSAIQGNSIGTDVTGTAAIANTLRGIWISASNSVLVGGTAAGAGNLIANNTTRGISVSGTSTGVTILGNRIHSNGSLGIDLGDNGLTANDAGDGDSGPNALLNWPSITSAFESGGTVKVYFRLDVAAGWYRVEFFKNPSGADPSGNGEGETFVAATTINHPGGGPVTFNHSFAGAVGDRIATTMTVCSDGASCAAFGSTSEFGNTFASTTAVSLTSFTATGRDRVVELAWQTGSELNNLGFHLYRATSAGGSYTRITSSVIPGLGSSALGASYSYRDTGLVNGTTYYYKLEDIETTGRTKQHGPVSATPTAAAQTAEQRAQSPAEDTQPEAGPARASYGDPSKVGLRIVERGANRVVLELKTGGFYAEPLSDGTVRLTVPGFETLSAPGLVSLPVERTMLEAGVGRQVRIASAEPFELVSFSSLRPEDAGEPEMRVRRDGTVRASRRRAGHRAWVGAYPESAARVVSVGFQGETKKALLELAPLRWDEGTGQLLLARRLRVEVVFSGREEREIGQGVRGRRAPREKASVAGVVARLSTHAAGLHAVSFEQVLPGRRRGMLSSELSLSRQGEKVAFHVTPDPSRFVSGSRLYFVSAGPDANPEGNEAVYELSLGQQGLVMGEASAAPAGATLVESTAERRFELNRYYLSSVATPWLWEYLRWGERKSVSFSLTGVAASGAAGRIEISLQGVSDYPVSPDHHIRASLNGTLLGEVSWDGKLGQALEAEVPAGVLREGENALELENLPDTAAGYSLVYLDRFTLRYPHALVAEAGRFEGSLAASGEASVAGLATGALLLDTTGTSPVWLMGAVVGGRGLGFRAEAGHGYLAVSPEAVLAPEVRLAASSTLRALSNQADYLLLTPRAFLTEAEVLLEHRRDQGLSARAVAIEEIFEEFGHGEGGPQAIHDFLAYAYHHWSAPSPRYVLLLGDASYDPKDYLGLHRQNLLPTPQVQTSYLWTASDPALASLNGEDGLPDIALGRLSASTAAEAQVMIQKILAWETAGFTPLAGPATLVADNPDPAGDFESDAEEIAQGWLGGREVERIYLSRLGTLNARSAVKGAFERGSSLMSYIGHGSTAIWASEQMLNTTHVAALTPQAQQPLVLAMNCLNGYFITPWSDSLAEKLVKAEGKGAIAAFTSSGLSLNVAAKVYHEAMLDQILHGDHERLGDALLAAQSAYADSGADPELLAIYHLFGDPALKIR